jgi:hypothetical protein
MHMTPQALPDERGERGGSACDTEAIGGSEPLVICSHELRATLPLGWQER